MRLLAGWSWFLVLAASAAGEPTVEARLAEAVAAQAESGRFMGSVLVARGDEVVFQMSTGWANAEWEAANSASTRFRIGSITKQFTAAAILLLEERGKLAVDDPLAKHLEGTPAAWRRITLRHLLTHGSGVTDFTALPRNREWEIAAPTPSQMLAVVGAVPLGFSPGSEFAYSNSNYLLLGWVIERISGRTYREFLRQNIFEPLGLENSGYDSNVAVIPRRAAGYISGARGLRNANYIDMRGPHAAGGLYSTTGDLHKWTRALFGGKLLRSESLAKMTAARGNYGFGLGIGVKNGRQRCAHAGGIRGFASFLAYFPASEVTIVVLANIEGPAAAQLAEQLERIYFGD